MVLNRNVQNCPEVSQRINSRLYIYMLKGCGIESSLRDLFMLHIIWITSYLENCVNCISPRNTLACPHLCWVTKFFVFRLFGSGPVFFGVLVSFSLRANQKGDLTAGIRKPYHHLPHSSRTSPINIRGRTTPMYMRSHETSGIPLFTWFCAIVNTLIYLIFYSAGVRGIYAG